jgi:hypothetical protein
MLGWDVYCAVRTARRRNLTIGSGAEGVSFSAAMTSGGRAVGAETGRVLGVWFALTVLARLGAVVIGLVVALAWVREIRDVERPPLPRVTQAGTLRCSI